MILKVRATYMIGEYVCSVAYMPLWQLFGISVQKVFKANLNFLKVPTSKQSKKIKAHLSFQLSKWPSFLDCILIGT